MGIVLKKIGTKEYAYHAYRVGNKVVQKYIGPASHPAVAAKMDRFEEGKGIPSRFRHLFWDVDLSKIHMKRNTGYIIERVLEMGNLDALLWLQRIYPTALIIETLESSRKISSKSRNFWEIWFRLSHT